MRLDTNPLFRRIIMPWYDSTPVCWMLLVCMLIVLLFSIMGIVVAVESPVDARHQWVPWALALLSLFVGVSVALRLIHRHQLQHKDTAEP